MIEYVKAEWGIPHCQFAPTATGFRVEYRRQSFGAFAGSKAVSISLASLAAAGGGASLLVLLILIVVPLLVVGFFIEHLGPVLGIAAAAGLTGFVLTWLIRRIISALSGKTTTIEVTREAVVIDDKNYQRAAFGGFAVALTHKPHGDVQSGHLDTGEMATLSFSYGNTTLPLPGVWPQRQAQEFAASLNRHLRSAPQLGDEQRPSPEQLRSTSQSTDF